MVIHLDPRASFSTGEPVTAWDVKNTFEMLSRYGSLTRRALAAKIKTFSVVDDHTIHLVFNSDEKGLYDRDLPLVFLLMPVFSAAHITPETFCKSGLTPLIGSGPYTVSDVHPGKKITYKRNPSYWGKDLPTSRGLFNADFVSVDIFYSDLPAFEAFKRGLIDIWVEEDLGRWKNGYDCAAVREGTIRRQEIVHGQPVGIYGFVFNQDRSALKDQRVRQAVMMAFDYNMLSSQLSQKDHSRTESFYQNSLFQASDSLSKAEQDVINLLPIPLAQTTLPSVHEHSFSKALELFAEAGWHPKNNLLVKKGVPLTLTILIKSKDFEQARLAETLATCLRRVGITVHIQRRENTQFIADLRARNFDIALWKWITSLSPGIEQTLYWHSRSAAQPSTRNYGNIRNPNVDFLCDKILECTSVEDLTATTKVLDRVLRQGYYILPLFHKTKDYRAFWKHIKTPPFPSHSPYWPATESFWIHAPHSQAP
jgi:ABC-type oligopeptide transport system substrate-binding subunit